MAIFKQILLSAVGYRGGAYIYFLFCR